MSELKLPNFEALGDWHDQLEEWCKKAVGEIAGLESRVNFLRGFEERAEKTEGDAEAYDGVMRDLADVARGIYTFEEIWDKWRPRWE